MHGNGKAGGQWHMTHVHAARKIHCFVWNFLKIPFCFGVGIPHLKPPRTVCSYPRPRRGRNNAPVLSRSYPGSILNRGPSDHHGADARTKKASQAFGALRDRALSSKGVFGQLKCKVPTPASPGVSRPGPLRACPSGTTSAPARCAA